MVHDSSDVIDFDIDLMDGVVPVSKGAGSLAALIRRSRQGGKPVVITQRGYPSGVLLSVELFQALRERALRATPERSSS